MLPCRYLPAKQKDASEAKGLNALATAFKPQPTSYASRIQHFFAIWCNVQRTPAGAYVSKMTKKCWMVPPDFPLLIRISGELKDTFDAAISFAATGTELGGWLARFTVRVLL